MNLEEARAKINALLDLVDAGAECDVTEIVMQEIEPHKNTPRYFAPRYRLVVDLEILKLKEAAKC
jgi:hypothetical protein